MKLTEKGLLREANATGFPRESLEKAFYLLSLLKSIGSHPYLKNRVVLKGGTALNLFFFKVPRLSVDIDLNYVGAVERETMLSERPLVEEAVQAVCQREGLSIKRIPSDHAGGKWRLTYSSLVNRSGNLELDLNFLLRSPLWPPIAAESRPLGSRLVVKTRMVDLHELAAGKLVALLARNTARDLFDARSILSLNTIDVKKLRLAFVVYGGMSRRDWREVSIEDVKANPDEIKRELVPMLRADLVPAPGDIDSWSRELEDECRSRLDKILPLNQAESEFITRLNDGGEVAPDLLTEDAELQALIRKNPGLRWKALNVRKHRQMS